MVQIERTSLRDRQDQERRGNRVKQRIAVRFGRHGSLGGDEPAGTRSVDDHRLLLPNVAEAIGNDPQDYVRAVSGWRLHDDLNGLAWIAPGMRDERRTGGQEANSKRHNMALQFHDVLGLVSVGDNVVRRRYKRKLEKRITS